MAANGQDNVGHATSGGGLTSGVGEGKSDGLFRQFSDNVGQPRHRAPLTTSTGVLQHSSGMNSNVHIKLAHVGNTPAAVDGFNIVSGFLFGDIAPVSRKFWLEALLMSVFGFPKPGNIVSCERTEKQE